ncbi:hypothetical protein D3C81_1354550 [compost metagenome]
MRERCLNAIAHRTARILAGSLFAGPEENHPHHPEEPGGLPMFDDQPGILDHRLEALRGENLYMIGRLVITRGGDTFLQMLANRCRHAEQIQRTGPPHTRQFGHERLRLVDVLRHLHAHHSARATVRQRQGQAVADEPQTRPGTLSFNLTRQLAHFVVLTVGEDHRCALTYRKQSRGTLATTDIKQGVFRRYGEALEQFAAVIEKPAVQNRITQTDVARRPGEQGLRFGFRCRINHGFVDGFNGLRRLRLG